jgi:DNA-binding protein HU-beta
MTLDDLSAALSAKFEIPKSQATDLVHALVAQVGTALEKGERVALPGLGAFSVASRKARTGRNPRTGEPIAIAARKVIKFSAASSLERSVNGTA